jgi:hypothetical protein
MAAAADDVEFCAALARIGWNNEAATALIGEGFTTMSDIDAVTQEFLELVCKKIRTGRPAQGDAVPAVAPVNIPMLNEFRLYGMHAWVTFEGHTQPNRHPS